MMAVPYHVAFIMDGNGRWAKSRGRPRLVGHRAGAAALHRTVEACARAGIKIVTVYAFSTENWDRPRDEVTGLMRLLAEQIAHQAPALHENGVQIRHIGTERGVAPALVKRIRGAVELTRNNTRLILNVAFNYGGRAEIVDAVRRIVAEGVPLEQIDEDAISRRLYTAGLPDPDLVVRTGGEMRISNFLVWQASYAEYYSTSTFWPDFGEVELRRALDDFARRQRRFGKVPGAAEQSAAPVAPVLATTVA
jgi:undecaprenyl diphosphate synthase